MASVFQSYYDEATLSTERHFAPKVVDQWSRSTPLTMRLKQNAVMVDGGESLELVSAFASGDGQWFAEWDPLNAAHKEQLGSGRVEWAFYTTPVVLSQAQLLKNSGSRTRRIDLAKQKNIIAARTAADDFDEALWYATGGLTNAIDTLVDAVSDNSEGGAYGGITRSGSGDGLLWDAQVDGTTTTLSLSAMQTLYGSAQEGTERPNLIVCTRAVWNSYWNLLTPIQRLGSDEMGKAGFTSLLFNGVPVVEGSKVPTGDMFMLNMNYLDLAAHPQAFFSFERSTMPSNQWVHIGRYFLMGNIRLHAPRYQAKFTALTA